MSDAFHLTLLVGPVVPLPVPREVLDALTDVETTISSSGPSGFKLSFAINNRSPLHTAFLVAAGQTPLLRVLLVLTVKGVPQVLMDGVMTQHNLTPGSQPGQSVLTIMGDDLTRVMDLIDFTGFLFPAMPSPARVALIVAKYAMFGMIPLVIPPLTMDVPIPTDRIPTQEGTDLAYIRDLAAEVGHVFYINPGPLPGMNTAYWGPEIKLGVPQPALNLDLDAYTNVESLSFDFDSTKGVLPIVFIQNQLTRVPIPIPIPKLNPLQPPLGAISTSITGVTVLRDTAKMSPMQAIGRGIAEAARSQDAVKARGSLNVVRYGRLLQARGLVGVRGAGLAFDGLYFVDSVTTTLKRGELKQSFELTRNGIVSLTPVVPP